MKEYKKILQDLTSCKEEYDLLDAADHIFIIYGKEPDDNEIYQALDMLDHYDWYCKLRGEFDGPIKIANLENNQKWFHGYVYAVTNENLINFEKSVILMTLSTGYNLEKLDLYNTKKEIKENHFNKLFEAA